MQTQAKSSAAVHHIPNPLLAPLMAEGATAMRNPVCVDMPPEHPAKGSSAVQGAEYVSIAYMPLQSEAEARNV